MSQLPDTPASMTYSPNATDSEGEVSLRELIANLWEGRYLILGALLLALMAGGYYVWRKSPTYAVNAMLQIEDKKGSKGGVAMLALEGMFSQNTVAQAEIEIIKSNLVLGRAVQALSLDIQTTPDFNRFVGDAPVRHRADAPELVVERFELPEYQRGRVFRVIALEGGVFNLETYKGEKLATGKVGDDIQATYQDQPLRLRVQRLVGPPGQAFYLSRQPMLMAIQGLRGSLQIVEKGKQTNILALTFEHRNPVVGAEILNEIVNQYVAQNIGRKAEEASKTLGFLQEQMPQLKGKLEVAEERFNQYRRSSGSVDLPEEAKLLLRQSVELGGQVLVLKQKRQELLRTYREGADVVATLDQQLAKLAGESELVESKVRGLPGTQQEAMRLMREVQVNGDLYTALLNNVQQLQITKAGEIGNARIVDHAMPSLGPIRPQKPTVIAFAGMLGLFVGMGLAILRRALHRGVEDPRLIESRLGLSVVVTVPHSTVQTEVRKALERREGVTHLLALEHPGDLAIESLRSLRTSLHFTMLDAQNRVVLITGPSPSIGKSFLSSNFATVLAQTGNRVLLVDGDLRKGTLHLPFGLVQRGQGLSAVLSGDKTWQEVICPTEIPGLDLITSGVLPPNPSELLMSSRLPDFIKAVSGAYDLVIIDAPPVLAVTDPVILARQAGTTLLLVKAKVHGLDEIRAALQRFEQAGIKVNGCIFNDVPEVKAGYRYYRYVYHYGYKK